MCEVVRKNATSKCLWVSFGAFRADERNTTKSTRNANLDLLSVNLVSIKECKIFLSDVLSKGNLKLIREYFGARIVFD